MNAILSKAVAVAATTAAAAGAKRVAEIGWERATGNRPPTAVDVVNDRDLRDLVVWVAVVTVAVAVARTLAQKGADRLN
ncbi:MAG: DUF4235 domain-containing protein [Nitriliruptor sp.]|nr:MAG: DUF4235 domain-containing protein [Nitriliruptor sp.]